MKTEVNIRRLIAKCKKQEWAAQKELYLLFADEMMSIAIRYVKDLPSAKDLVQDTFLTFFKKINQYDPQKGTLGAWLSRILINTAFGEYRKNKKIVYIGDDAMPDQVSDESSALDKLEAEDLIKLINRLPEGTRIIFNLKVIEGYSHTEIGKMLQITASTSRSQLTRAKKLLRVMIADSGLYGTQRGSNEESKQEHSIVVKTKVNGRAV